jgi:hypothetical protein
VYERCKILQEAQFTAMCSMVSELFDILQGIELFNFSIQVANTFDNIGERCVLNVFVVFKIVITTWRYSGQVTISVFLVLAGVLGGSHRGRRRGRCSVQVPLPDQERGGRDQLVWLLIIYSQHTTSLSRHCIKYFVSYKFERDSRIDYQLRPPPCN